MNKEAAEWSSIFESLKGSIFDYLLRMTGQINRSMETLAELQAVMAGSMGQYATRELLRQALFTTARSFNADIWNAGTSMLSNSAYGSAKDLGDRRDVEMTFQSLPGSQREILLLLGRFGFAAEQAAKIMDISPEMVDVGKFSALRGMAVGLAGKDTGLAFLESAPDGDWEKVVGSLLSFEPPASSGQRTADLSVLIQDLQDSRFSWARRHPVLTGVLVVALILAALWLVNSCS